MRECDLTLISACHCKRNNFTSHLLHFNSSTNFEMVRVLSLALSLVVAVNAAGKVWDIDVGEDSSLAFSPNTLTAAVGDT